MDWIKVEKATPNKPEFRAIARACNCTRAEVFLAWFRIWCTFDDLVGEDGFLSDYTVADVDEDSGIKGLGAALEQVGWVVFSPQGCSITNWGRHNGKSAKQRAMASRRSQSYRARQGDGAP